MLYTAENAMGATVHDVESGASIGRVMEINTKNGWIKVCHAPARLTPQGDVLTERIRFRSIYPIWAGQSKPVMFHCYGKQA